MNILKVFIPLSKVDEEQRMVFGYATTEALDSQGEVIARAAVEDALPEYMRFANIREMHTMSAVGVAKQAEMDGKGLYLGAKVVDEAAWGKVKEGVYKGFSIGGRALAKADGVITKMRLTEISLVDRPANPECTFDTWKADSLEAGDDVSLRLPAEVAEIIKGMKPEDVAAVLAKAAEAATAPQQSQQSPQPDTGRADLLTKYAGEEVWDAARAIDALSNIFDLFIKETNEAETNPEQVAALQAVITGLKAFIASEIMEDNKPQTVTIFRGEGEGDIGKAGAKFSKATKEALGKVHAMLRDCNKAMEDMGYATAEDDVAQGEGKPDLIAAEVVEVAKAAGFELAEGALYADLAKAALADLAKAKVRIGELEKMPLAPKAAVTAVGKSDDVKDGLADDGKAAQPNNPLDVFKAALARPVMVGG